MSRVSVAVWTALVALPWSILATTERALKYSASTHVETVDALERAIVDNDALRGRVIALHNMLVSENGPWCAAKQPEPSAPTRFKFEQAENGKCSLRAVSPSVPPKSQPNAAKTTAKRSPASQKADPCSLTLRASRT